MRHDPQWMEDHIGKTVAIVGEEIVDEDTDLTEITKRIGERYGDQPVYMPIVTKVIVRDMPSILSANRYRPRPPEQETSEISPKPAQDI